MTYFFHNQSSQTSCRYSSRYTVVTRVVTHTSPLCLRRSMLNFLAWKQQHPTVNVTTVKTSPCTILFHHPVNSLAECVPNVGVGKFGSCVSVATSASPP